MPFPVPEWGTVGRIYTGSRHFRIIVYACIFFLYKGKDIPFLIYLTLPTVNILTHL